MNKYIRTLSLALLLVCLFSQSAFNFALSEDLWGDPEPYGDDWYEDEYFDTFTMPIPSAKLWGASENDVKASSNATFAKCSVSKAQGLKTKIDIGNHTLEAYYVFGKDMGKYYGLSKVAYILPNDKERPSSELTVVLNEFVGLMSDEIGEPDSATKSLSKWETPDYTVEIGKGKFTAYTGHSNSTVGIVIKGKSFYNSVTPTPKPTPKHTAALSSGAEREKLKTYTRGYFSFSIPSNWMEVVEGNNTEYIAPDQKRRIQVVGGSSPNLVYLSSEGFIHFMKEAFEEFGDGTNASIYGLPAEINGLPAVIGSINKGISHGYVMATYYNDFLLMIFYIEDTQGFEDVYDSAMKYFRTVQLSAEYSNSNKDSQTNTYEEPWESSNNDSSQFTGPMVTVYAGGKALQVHKSFKDAMDSYEAFFDSYFRALASDDIFQLMDFIGRYDDMKKAFDDLENTDMTEAELAYYTVVQLRIIQKIDMYG